MSSDDPYEILGVNRNASTSEIKSAYRKLALKFHPDKQKGNEDDRAKAAAIFTKIGNAYEILSDDDARKKFDMGGFASSSSGPSSRPSSRHTSPFDHFFDADPFAGFGFNRNSNRQGFSDPFELFNRVFEEEFGSRSSFRNHKSAFDDDPFFSSSFGGRGSGFGMMDQMMSSMMRGHTDMFNNSHHHQTSEMPRMGGEMRQFSSSSFSRGGSGGGVQQSVSTRTVIVNGKRKSITERTTVKPDGTVETHVEESCDDDFPSKQALENGRRSSKLKELQRRVPSRRPSRK